LRSQTAVATHIRPRPTPACLTQVVTDTPQDPLDLIAEAGRERAERLEERERRRTRGRALYSNDQAQPTLRRSFVAYLDALGTRQRIAQLDDDALREQVRLLDQLRGLLHEDNQNDDQRLLSFSDNVVLAS